MSEGKTKRAFLILGSNIEPEQNIPEAINRLQKMVVVQSVSNTWETRAFGSPGPNFLNTALMIYTRNNAPDLKYNLIRPMEEFMGRVRTTDKNAPRTIDIDILIYDNEIMDESIWSRIFLAVPLAEIYPNLEHPVTCKRLWQVADEMRQNITIKQRLDVRTRYNALSL
ncbi:MAG: 2-amino-4-hydroxy-6-hydroxymethyldihydropteridine diphosphokinase [Anaerolineaceae bacterium]|nr:2-amino-4-hydroxy-6-hydroxymethyldihydropteridine diphosphokinase [Anaerolineaceae bacterium]